MKLVFSSIWESNIYLNGTVINPGLKRKEGNFLVWSLWAVG